MGSNWRITSARPFHIEGAAELKERLADSVRHLEISKKPLPDDQNDLVATLSWIRDARHAGSPD